jgi:hypothetical protein
MGQNLQIVFSRFPDHVDEAEFNEWYDAHLPEILSIPGFVSARRFRLEPVVADPELPVRYRYLALYEIEGDPERLLDEMRKRELGTRDSYRQRKAHDQGDPPLPDWWDEVRFASWNCIALGEPVTAQRSAGDPASAERSSGDRVSA